MFNLNENLEYVEAEFQIDNKAYYARQRANGALILFSFDVVDTRSIPRDGGMAEDHGALETVKLSRALTRGRRETESRQKAALRVRSWTVQNDMSCVLGQVSAGAAGRIFDSANPREIRA